MIEWSEHQLDVAVDEILVAAVAHLKRLAGGDADAEWTIQQRLVATLGACAYQDLVAKCVESLGHLNVEEDEDLMMHSTAWLMATEGIAASFEFQRVRDYLRASRMIGSSAPLRGEGGRLPFHLLG